MATGSRYLGPSDAFIVGDKVYKPGDVVPLSKEMREHHALYGHRFEDVNPVGDLAEAPMSDDVTAKDDSGAPIAEAKAKAK
jgi:hypothetical protein